MAGAPHAASRFGFHGFVSITRTIACGVTAVVVGSGALLGLFFRFIRDTKHQHEIRDDASAHSNTAAQKPTRHIQAGIMVASPNAAHTPPTIPPSLGSVRLRILLQALPL